MFLVRVSRVTPNSGVTTDSFILCFFKYKKCKIGVVANTPLSQMSRGIYENIFVILTNTVSFPGHVELGISMKSVSIHPVLRYQIHCKEIIYNLSFAIETLKITDFEFLGKIGMHDRKLRFWRWWMYKKMELRLIFICNL